MHSDGRETVRREGIERIEENGEEMKGQWKAKKD